MYHLTVPKATCWNLRYCQDHASESARQDSAPHLSEASDAPSLEDIAPSSVFMFIHHSPCWPICAQIFPSQKDTNHIGVLTNLN